MQLFLYAKNKLARRVDYLSRTWSSPHRGCFAAFVTLLLMNTFIKNHCHKINAFSSRPCCSFNTTHWLGFKLHKSKNGVDSSHSELIIKNQTKNAASFAYCLSHRSMRQTHIQLNYILITILLSKIFEQFCPITTHFLKDVLILDFRWLDDCIHPSRCHVLCFQCSIPWTPFSGHSPQSGAIWCQYILIF